MTKAERFEYILKLEREQSERKHKELLAAAKRERAQRNITCMISFAVAQSNIQVMALLGLCESSKKGGE